MNTAAVKATTAETVKMTIKQWANEDRPSVKLQMYGVEALSDSELLAILIGSGTNHYTAVDIAQNLLDKFDQNLNSLGKARFDELNDVEGVGTYTSCKIMAAVELGKRRQKAAAEVRPDMSTATRIYQYLHPRMMDLQTEEFYILLMNQNYKLLKAECISHGGLTEVSVDVRVIMREAVLNNTCIMAIAHNHPSGNIRPSKVDDMLTQSVKKACELLRIHLTDHVIVTDGFYYSYAEEGRL